MVALTQLKTLINDNFKVYIDGMCFGASNITLPKVETEKAEYRDGDDDPHMHKIPGKMKYGDLVIERGFRKNDFKLGDLIFGKNIASESDKVLLNLEDGMIINDVKIEIYDRGKKLADTKHYKDCWASDYETDNLDSKGNDILKEKLTLQVDYISKSA
jgi:phage tail-like protein